MDKWEYCYVCHHNQRGYEDIIIIKDGKSEKKFAEEEATLENALKLLNQLGFEGWELIGATNTGNEHGWTLRKSL